MKPIRADHFLEMAKIGPNQLCPCGSGKKYKRCHGSVNNESHVTSAMRFGIAQAQAQRVQRERQQGLGRPIISAVMGEHRFVAVGNRLQYSNGWKTFHDFLGDYIKNALGPEWGTSELEKPLAERHPILVWYHHVCELQREYIKTPGQVHLMPKTGAAGAYLHLAYDLYALDHNAELQTKLTGRLRDKDNFEGARYEVYVAATLIRAGFDVAFENEDDRSSSHCEFVATHQRTGKRFSVEAKHRAGNKFRLGRQLNRALRKVANYPRVVFIDINIPDGKKIDASPDRLQTALGDLRSFEGKQLNGKPLPEAYIFVTNTPWHLHLRDTNIHCEVLIEGFQIPDFKGDVPAPSLRAAINAREKHIEMHDLIRSIQDHSDVPVTFDGEIPELAFGKSPPRLIIGQKYLIADEQGIERPGLLTSATVVEHERKIYGGMSFDDGTSAIYTWPISDNELKAWKRHPDTFFGRVEYRKTRINTPLELYDFHMSSYSNTPRERLLELLEGHPDIEALRTLDQRELASIFSEHSTLSAWAHMNSAPKNS
jgi:hypothetical protein